jgi:hypothetical protein
MISESPPEEKAAPGLKSQKATKQKQSHMELLSDQHPIREKFADSFAEVGADSTRDLSTTSARTN